MAISVTQTPLEGLLVINPRVFGDDRGFFLEFWNEQDYSEAGITTRFVQDNHSSSSKGVLRGMHYQLGRPQVKLVRVISGKVFDVAVDMRPWSSTFGKWHSEILSADNKTMLYIPEGFAHGFFVLSDTAEFMYKCSDFYAPEEERGVLWNDPQIGIDWPLDNAIPLLSEKDRLLPLLGDIHENDLPRNKGK